jgi:hypothetical protein
MSTQQVKMSSGQLWQDADAYLRGDHDHRGVYFVPDVHGAIMSTAGVGAGRLCGVQGFKQQVGTDTSSLMKHNENGQLVISSPTAFAGNYKAFSFLYGNSVAAYPFLPRANWTTRIALRCAIGNQTTGEFAFGLVKGAADPGDFHSTLVNDCVILKKFSGTNLLAAVIQAGGSGAETIGNALHGLTSGVMVDVGLVVEGLTKVTVVVDGTAYQNDAVTEVPSVVASGMFPAIIVRASATDTGSVLTLERMAITQVPDANYT